jgi:Zn-dependent protease
MRRLTLNPLAHIDPIGFIALLLVRFGWAKPVPINPRNFHNQGRDTALVSLAGPFSNFLMAWLLAGVIKFVPMDPNSLLAAALTYAIWINLALGVFNLIPIPPLDGSKIAEFLLPYQYAWRLKQLEPYGMFILLFILFSPLREVLFAVIESIFKLLV